MVVRYGALKIAKLLKVYTMIFSVCEKVPNYICRMQNCDGTQHKQILHVRHE